MSNLRWGIIGTGDVAERKGGPALYKANRSELSGVTNRNLDKAHSFAQRHGNPTVFSSVEELLASELIDAVYIATPPDSHRDLTIQCAEVGKHVLCEKPMAFSTAECDQMIAACESNSVSLAIAYYRRHFPVFQQIKTLLDDGRIGQPRRVCANTYSMFTSDTAEPWRLNTTIGGGGFLMDVGTHRFDLMAYLFGPPVNVAAVLGTQCLDTAVEDAASICLEFADGVQGTASFQWNSPIARDSFEVVGSEGILWTDSLSDEGRLWLQTKSGTQHWELPAKAPVHLQLVSHFVDHLLDGASNPLPGESGRIATSITNQCYGKE